MEPVQENWITQLSGAAVSRKIEKKKWDARDQALTQVREKIAINRDRLLADMNLIAYDDESAVVVNEKGETVKKQGNSEKDKKHQQRILDYGSRDQTLEFDWAEQFEGWNLMTDKDLERHAEATNLINDMVGELESATIQIENPPGSGNLETVPIFEKEDIADEFYTPLVREGLLAETFVPNDFSRTHKMIEGAFDEYKGRLEEEGFSKMAVVGEYLKLGVSIGASAASFASSIATFKDAAALNPNDVEWSKFGVFVRGSEDQDWIKKLGEKGTSDLTGFTDVLSKGMDAFKDVGVEGGIAISEKLKKKYEDSNRPLELLDKRLLMAGRIADSLVSGVSGVVSQSMSIWDMGLTASSVYRSGANLKKITKLLQDETLEELTPANGGEIVNFLKAGFAKVFIAFNTFPDPIKGIAAAAVGEIERTFASNCDASGIASRINDGEYPAAMKLATDAAVAAMATATGNPDLCDAIANNKGQIIRELGVEMTNEFNAHLGEIQVQQEDDKKKIKDTTSAQLKAPLIAKKIAEIEKARTALKWAKSFSSMSVAVASKFFAPLAIAGSAISLAENLTEAVIRVRDAANFLESEIDMLRDASAYSAPIANFVKNAELQAIHFEIRAALDLINMIGAIIETAGYATGPGAAIGIVVGKSMQASASAYSALEAVMYEISKKVDASLGWNKYKEALLKPENRKLALLAMKANPTLAKYSVAWGAIIEKDPLVADFVTKTGLTVESLEDPKANVGLVVQYLEARMPEDNVIVGREAVGKGWAPAPALTLECWSAAIRRGKEEANLVVDGQEGLIQGVEYGILACIKPWSEIDPSPTALSPTKGVVEANLSALQTLIGALGRYRPQRSDGSKTIEHAQMREFLGSMRGLAETRIKSIEDVFQVVEWTDLADIAFGTKLGESQKTAVRESGGGPLKYSFDDDQQLPVGVHQLSVYAEASGKYKQSPTVNANITVVKAEQEVEWGADFGEVPFGTKLDGSQKTATSKLGDVPLKYSFDDDQQLPVGEHQLSVYAEATDNYNQSPPAYANIKVVKAEQEVEWGADLGEITSTTTLGLPQRNATRLPADGGELKYSFNDGDLLAAGDHQLSVYAEETNNYNQSPTVTREITVVAAS